MKKYLLLLMIGLSLVLSKNALIAQQTNIQIIPQLACSELSPIIENIEVAAPNTSVDVVVTGHYFTSNMTADVMGANVVNGITLIGYDTISINITTANVGTYTLTLYNDCGVAQTDFTVTENTCLIPDNSGATVWQNVSVGNTTGSGTFSDTGTINGWSNVANFGSISGEGCLCFTVDNHVGNVAIMIGLNDTPTTTNWTDIEHKFYLRLRPTIESNLYVANGGSIIFVNSNGATGTYDGKRFCIERTSSNTIIFTYDGTIIFPTAGTQTSLISGDLYVSINAYYSPTIWNGNINLSAIELCPK